MNTVMPILGLITIFAIAYAIHPALMVVAMMGAVIMLNEGGQRGR